MTALTPSNGDPNAAAIYRFFDSTDRSHFYTASSAERDSLIASRPDMVYEAVGTFYEHLNPQPGDVPVYRFFDSSNGTHFYTDSATERASVLSTRPDMVAEGISFYEAPKTKHHRLTDHGPTPSPITGRG